MDPNELQARIDQLFIPKPSPAQEALSQLESIADRLEESPLNELDAGEPSLDAMASTIRRCVDAIKLALI